MLLRVWRLAFVLVAMTRLASADVGSADVGSAASQAPQPAEPTTEHHKIGIIFVLISAGGLLILSKVLPRTTRSEKPKDPP
jgi:hypothetical protein